MAFPGSSLLEKEPTKSQALEYLLPCCSDAFLDHGASYECHSISPWTGCVFTCRRSPRLLTNGYYILNEDSFLSDEDGNVTLSPSQTNVTYKEKLVRIFRRRRRIDRSFVSLFNVSASKSWLNNTVCSDTDSPHGEEAWFEGDSKMDYNDTTGVSLEYETQTAERHDPALKNASPFKDVTSMKSRKQPYSPPCTLLLAEEEQFHEKSLDSSEFFTVKSNRFQMIMLSMCLITALLASFFLGGLFTTLMTCLLLITLIYAGSVLASKGAEVCESLCHNQSSRATKHCGLSFLTMNHWPLLILIASTCRCCF